MFGESGEGLHLALEAPLLVLAHVIPCRDLLGTWSQFCICGDHSQGLLPGEDFFPQLVPAAVELTFVFVDPGLRSVMGGMGRTRCEVHVERFVGREGLLGAYPADRLVRHVNGEMIARSLRRLYARDAVKDGGSPLIGFSSDESVELVEA